VSNYPRMGSGQKLRVKLPSDGIRRLGSEARMVSESRAYPRPGTQYKLTAYTAMRNDDSAEARNSMLVTWLQTPDGKATRRVVVLELPGRGRSAIEYDELLGP
jgi:hypothetical protein